MPLFEVESPWDFPSIGMVPNPKSLQIKADSEVLVLIKTLNESSRESGWSKYIRQKIQKGNIWLKVMPGQIRVKFAFRMLPYCAISNGQKDRIPIKVLIPLECRGSQRSVTGCIYGKWNNTRPILRWLRLGRDFGDSVESMVRTFSAEEDYIISARW